MGTRAFGVLAATLAVITGGIGGGAVAFAAFAPPAPLVVQTVPDTAIALERTIPAFEARAIAPSASVSTETSAAPAADSVLGVPAAAPAAAATCPSAEIGATPGAPGIVSAGGVAGTSSADLDAFASAYNAQRVAQCLLPVPLANFRYDTCMEQRLFWMAEDPSTDTSSAWGHIGSTRSDGVPSVGCDGNLAGGYNNVGTTFARKWWDSTGHRISVYNPAYTGSMANVCIYFAVTHGGVPDEPVAFARAAARWGDC